jgi:hypothetical protein
MPNAVESLKSFIANPNTFASVLLTIYIDTYGNEPFEEHQQMPCLTWHPNTIQMEIEQDFGLEIPGINFEKLMTAISLYTTNNFFVSTTDFVRFCVVLSGHAPAPELMVLPDCADLAWGITEGVLIMPPEETEQNPFSQEIVGFVGKCLDSEGIITPPDVLRIGLRDKSLVDHVTTNFSDDEELYSSIWKMEKDKTDDINQLVSSNLRMLIAQMAALPLQTGKTQELVKRMSKQINQPQNLH